MLLSKNHIRRLLHAATLLLVLTGIGHIHSHLCLDGQETAQLVHFENFKGHPQHATDEVHEDVENELTPEGLLYKLPDVDVHFALLASVLQFELPQPTRSLQLVEDDNEFHQPPATLLPPLRAPPVLLS